MTSLSKKVLFKVTHPLYGSEIIFDSWTTLCEHTMELAEVEAKSRLMNQLLDEVSRISDEMIATAEEIDG